MGPMGPGLFELSTYRPPRSSDSRTAAEATGSIDTRQFRAFSVIINHETAGGTLRNRCTAILDVGKTHAKLSLWSAEGALLARRSRPNARLAAARYAALDAAGIEAWVAATLMEFAPLGDIGTIIPVGHGAAAALIREGRLACPPFDYESPIPAEIRARYDRERDEFTRTGSPALPDGLNLGVQLFWIEQIHPELAHADVTILPWPQYWAWVLSGVTAAEITSLGCHSDLWQPALRQPSALAVNRGWAERVAPLRRADEPLGPLRREWVERTGLPADTQVLCGLHDSNASLLGARGFPEIADHDATVVSTGTWFVAMRSPDDQSAVGQIAVPAGRDCLVNVDAYGHPIPSARFMGGRELELLTARDGARLDDPPDRARILGAITRWSRTVRWCFHPCPGFGPYPHASHSWASEPRGPDAHRAAAGLYAALVMQNVPRID